jgi:hypothetical protein
MLLSFLCDAEAGNSRRSAYLNYIFFDDHTGFDQVNQSHDAGWTLVPETAYMSKTLMQLNIPAIKKPGYLYIYLSMRTKVVNMFTLTI